MGDRYDAYKNFLEERIRKAVAAQAEKERLQRQENERRIEESKEKNSADMKKCAVRNTIESRSRETGRVGLSESRRPV